MTMLPIEIQAERATVDQRAAAITAVVLIFASRGIDAFYAAQCVWALEHGDFSETIDARLPGNPMVGYTAWCKADHAVKAICGPDAEFSLVIPYGHS